ncbi:efflux RND transporter periplasmic adaptor subunit [Desulfonema magnum]|uniref:Efflux transporter, RND family n=1 Tax=Desulfonema magnum TaxID=45655 RepID=A0A975GLE9_9BACT|nr:efflux RND transporter periplasmic adaptor subunit [Desulfonema magnum]QTA85574.1 Efflux transporter, RND family [Desulfonema magnum]
MKEDSMLKSEKLNRKALSRCGLFGTFTVLILMGVCMLWYSGLFASPKPEDKAAPPAMPPVTVEVSKVRIAPAVREIVTVGTLQANESVMIRSEVSGRITSIGFAEGEAIEQGKVLFTLDQSVLQAELQKARADLNLHLADYKRAKKLLKDKAISVRERDQAYARWQLDKANEQLIQANLDKTVIRSPFGGVLGIRKVSKGDFISAGQELVNLEDVSSLKVSFKIPEIYSGAAAAGQKIRLSSDAFGNEVFEAEVYAVNPRIDMQTRSLELRAVMENPDQRLRPGLFVRVALVADETSDALFVPEQAVMQQPERSFVWKVADNKPVMVEVITGKREKGMVEIQSGLEPGDMVITGGIQKVAEGMPVNAVEADPDMFAKCEVLSVKCQVLSVKC